MEAADYFAIQNLVYRYCLLVDTADFDGVGALFARASLDYGMGGEAFDKNPAAIAQRLRDAVQLYGNPAVPLTRHVCTNLIIESDGPDTAHAESSVFVLQATPNLPLQTIIAGRYHDRFARTDGQWHFTSRRFASDLMGDLSAHLVGGTG